jgi:hypothetical protein
MPTSATASSPLGLNARLTVSRAKDERSYPATPHPQIKAIKRRFPENSPRNNFDDAPSSSSALDGVFSFAVAAFSLLRSAVFTLPAQPVNGKTFEGAALFHRRNSATPSLPADRMGLEEVSPASLSWASGVHPELSERASAVRSGHE